MKFRSSILSVFLPIVLASFVTPQLSAKDVIVFSTAPTQSVKVTRAKYQPIADYLTRAIGVKVVLKPAENFIQYSRALIANEYDLVFDGPHFVAWRMARDSKFRHNVLVKLPGKLRFLVAVRNDLAVKKMKRLAGKRICAFASPNLLTLGFLDLYPNPSSVPIIISTKNFKVALKCAQKNKGVGAIMRDKFWMKIPGKLKKGLRSFYVSKKGLPHRAFSIRASISPEIQAKIKRALLSPAATKPAFKVLKQFKAHKKGFKPAKTAEYRGYGKLLKPIWGFHNQN